MHAMGALEITLAVAGVAEAIADPQRERFEQLVAEPRLRQPALHATEAFLEPRLHAERQLQIIHQLTPGAQRQRAVHLAGPRWGGEPKQECTACGGSLHVAPRGHITPEAGACAAGASTLGALGWGAALAFTALERCCAWHVTVKRAQSRSKSMSSMR